MGVEGVLGRHAPAHDGVQESLALAGVEAENLQGAEVLVGSQRGLRSVWHLGAWRRLQACWTRTISTEECSPRAQGSAGTTAPDALRLRLTLTSIFPPTLASKGGRGLSRSLFSCLRDCLLPPRVKQPQ